MRKVLLENIEFSYEENIYDGECTGEYTIERIWFAADECENEAEFTQTINVVDTTGPVFEDYTYYTSVACEDVDAYTLTANDNCGDATVEITHEQLNSGGCMGVLFRTYTATDDCGNETTATQILTIQDTTNPTLIGVPEDVMALCT